MTSLPLPRIIDAARIRDAVPLDLAAIAAVETAFALLAGGGIVMPPIQQVTPANGQTCIKSALATHGRHFVTKVSSIYPPNAALGLKNASGLMMLFDATTGYPVAVLLDGGWLTAVRTAAAGAVAAKWLARPDSRRVTVIGSGGQAALQVEALRLLFAIDCVTVHARQPDRGEGLARSLRDAGQNARYEADLGRAVADADIVVTATSAKEPFLGPAHVRAGVHITAMGADAPGKSELQSALLAAADVYACDSIDQCFALGEAGAAIARGDPPPRTPVALGSLIAAGCRPARTDEAVTIADLTGTGAQDLQIALLAMDRIGSLDQPAS